MSTSPQGTSSGSLARGGVSGFWTPSLTVVNPEIPYLPLETPEAGGGASVTPGIVSLILSTFAPVVTASDHKIVVPGTRALVISTFAPTVTASDHKTVTPGTAVLLINTFAPIVTGGAGLVVTPGTVSLVLTGFAPVVTASANVVVTPGTASLLLTGFAPTVITSDNKTVTPGTVALSLVTFAPSVTSGANVTVMPDTASLTLTMFAPAVTGGTGLTVIPGTASLVITTFEPTVTASSSSLGSGASHKQEKRRAINWSVPFSVRREELEEIEHKIEAIIEEIKSEKKQIDYTSNIYALNAINGRIDNLVERLTILSKERNYIQEILDRKVTPRVVKKKEKFTIKKVLFLLELLED